MYLFVVALHIVLCIFMILIILLQPAKGDMGAAFGGGGGGSSMFGPRGPASMLQRATTVVAVMFMGTSITLALYSDPKVMSDADMGSELEQIQREIAERNAKKEQQGEAPAEDPPSEE